MDRFFRSAILLSRLIVFVSVVTVFAIAVRSNTVASTVLAQDKDRYVLDFQDNGDKPAFVVADSLTHAGRIVPLPDNSRLDPNLASLDPRGTTIAYMVAQPEDSNFGQSLWTLDVSSGKSTLLVDGNERFWIMNPLWSPNARYIAYARIFPQRTTPVKAELWLFDTVTGSDTVLVADNSFGPAFFFGRSHAIAWSLDGLGVQYINEISDQQMYAATLNGNVRSLNRSDSSINIAPALQAYAEQLSPTIPQVSNTMRKPIDNLNDYYGQPNNNGDTSNPYSTAYLDNYSGGQWEGDGTHPGVDIQEPCTTTEVRLVADGRIWDLPYSNWVPSAGHNNCSDNRGSGTGSTWGNHVIVRHEMAGRNGYPGGFLYSIYAHLYNVDIVNLCSGCPATINALVGHVGSTGNSSGPHLHFQIDKSSSQIIPGPHEPFWPDPCCDSIQNIQSVIAATYNPMMYIQAYLATSGVTVYEHANYSGQQELFSVKDPYLNENPIGINRISSARVPNGWVLTVCTDYRYLGSCQYFFSDVSDFSAYPGLNDSTKSLKAEPLACSVLSASHKPLSTCPPPGPDTTPPSGSFTSPSNGATITSGAVTIAVTASDNQGGSGVREVRFSAKWNNQWQGIGVDYTSPYAINWDMCAANVPDGDVELGMEVWDNANNKWVYSEHYSNPHFNKQYNCSTNPPAGSWSIDYWLNTFLAGYPNAHSTDSAPYLFKDWGGNSPISGIGSTDWSARFTSTRYFPGGHYHFHADADDGTRIIVDGQGYDPNWWGSVNKDYDLSAGDHTVVIEYKQNSGNSKLQAWWRGPGAFPNTTQDINQWFAQYYPNRDLWGDPPLELNEGSGFLSRQWDLGGPGWGLPNDNFSARYRRTVNFVCGTYRFDLFTDDGARVKLDGNTIPGLDQWHDGVNGYVVNFDVTAGDHEVTVEHYENGGAAAVSLNWSLVAPCKADLQPFAPPGYTFPVVASSVQGTHTSYSSYADALTFFDWHFINNGGGVAAGPFDVELWIDNQLYVRYPFSSLNPGETSGFDDWIETVVQPGWHNVKMVIDPSNNVDEADETNNVWIGSVLWLPISGWKGEYFRNSSLDGIPWLTRDDAAIDFDWGYGSPDPNLPDDNFSMRWTRTVNFAPGLYRFNMRHDDGARLFIDDVPVIDAWGTCCVLEEYTLPLSGEHIVRMEAYELGGAANAALLWVNLAPYRVFLPAVMK